MENFLTIIIVIAAAIVVIDYTTRIVNRICYSIRSKYRAKDETSRESLRDIMLRLEHKLDKLQNEYGIINNAVRGIQSKVYIFEKKLDSYVNMEAEYSNKAINIYNKNVEDIDKQLTALEKAVENNYFSTDGFYMGREFLSDFIDYAKKIIDEIEDKDTNAVNKAVVKELEESIEEANELLNETGQPE